MATVDRSINLLIKAPNQKINDHPVECQLDWTVKYLKIHISETYPGKPAVEEQKLIYSGRLLHDHLKLKDILRYDEKGPHILHLVCSSKQSAVTPTVKDSQNCSPSFPSTSSSTEEGLRHRTAVQQINQNYSAALSMPTFPLNPEQVAQQMMAMQQMYAYYMTQYLQHAQTAGNLSTPGSPLPSTGAPQMHPIVNNGANQNIVAQQRPANEDVRMNAQGGPLLDDDDDEFRNRDWLDWFYILSRGLALFSIVYFYSSPGRFMIVIGLAILAYLYQRGWFCARQLQNGNNENIQEPEPRQNRIDNEEPEQPNRSTSLENQSNQQEVPSDVQTEESLDNETEVRQQEENRSLPFGATAWTFISSFFSSLIPEQPAPVDIN